MNTSTTNSNANRVNSSGTTTALQRYGRNLTQLAMDNQLDECIGRDKEIRRMETILCKEKKRNPILVGEPGVGKTAIVEGEALRIAAGAVSAKLANKEIWEIRIGDLLAGASMRGDFEERLKSVIDEIVNSNGRFILFIDEIHNISDGNNNNGQVSASNILKPYLARHEFQCIGATTLDEYQKYFEKDKALNRRFQKVKIEEASKLSTKHILKNMSKSYKRKNDLVIEEELLDYIVDLSGKYVLERFFPDKAIDILDESCAQVISNNETGHLSIENLNSKKQTAIANKEFEAAAEYHRLIKQLESNRNRSIKTLTKDVVERVTSEWTGIPIDHFGRSFTQKITNIRREFNEKIVGQTAAKNALLNGLKRVNMNLNEPGRPYFSCLSIGPSGVGKTDLAKLLAKGLYGSERHLLRIDMSEYQERYSVSRLIGSPPGYVGHEEGGQLIRWIRNKPFSLILFDEIEKAHPKVFDIFLQILEEGELTDGQGRKADFKNSIIILTSNIKINRRSEEKLGFSPNPQGNSVDDENRTIKQGLQQHIRTEIINRIDDIIHFDEIDRDQFTEIVEIQLNSLIEKIQNEKGIRISVEPNVVYWLANKSYSREFGAREVKRTIQKNVTDRIAELLSQNNQNPQELLISLNNNELNIRNMRDA